MLISCGSGYSQTPPWQWGRDAGGAGNDLGKAISTDSNGNSYTTGRFTSTCTFNSQSLTSYGGPDIYVSKYDSAGNCLWAKHGGSYDVNDIYGDEGDGIDIDANGNCYVTGNFYTQAIFGPFTLSCPTAHRQILLVKYDANGNEIWARQATSGSNCYSRSVAVDSVGNSYITGYLGGGVTTFGTYTVNGPGAFIVKYDSSGTPLFATKLCTNGGIDAYSIDIDQSGNSYITGYIQGTDIINGQTFTSSGDRDEFLIKVDASGNFLWLSQTQSMPGTYAYGWGVTVDNAGEPVVTGDYDNYVFAGTYLLSGAGCMTIKYDTAGNPRWAKQSVSSAGFFTSVTGLAITSDNNYNIVITGNYRDTASFDNVGLQDYGSQVFVVMYDSAGNCTWATGSRGQNSGAYGNGISKDNNGSYYIAGYYKSPPVFGSDTLGFAGGEDILVAKLGGIQALAAFATSDATVCPGTCINFSNLSLNATSYQWNFPGGIPSSGTAPNPSNICYNSPGNYDVTLIASNANSSDTLLFTNYISVYPFPPAQAILQSGDTLFANQGAIAYQWYYNTNIIPGATLYYYVAPLNGDYNVVAVDENGCEVEAAIFDVLAEIQLAVGNKPLAIYPNPVESKLTIEIRQDTITAIKIFNLIGEKIIEIQH
ncbi:MAG: SBBP repeat-containing protein, partial [Bacteroidetes bacterium]|nr:SBBP repeat-containing protein [Bacteroidota bacterium]